jgi:hypothetical protein
MTANNARPELVCPKEAQCDLRGLFAPKGRNVTARGNAPGSERSDKTGRKANRTKCHTHQALKGRHYPAASKAPLRFSAMAPRWGWSWETDCCRSQCVKLRLSAFSSAPSRAVLPVRLLSLRMYLVQESAQGWRRETRCSRPQCRARRTSATSQWRGPHHCCPRPREQRGGLWYKDCPSIPTHSRSCPPPHMHSHTSHRNSLDSNNTDSLHYLDTN